LTHLTLSLEEEICLLEKYGLTPNELLVIRVLLILQNDNNEELFHDLIVTFKHTNVSLRDILYSLQEKEVILKAYKIPKEGDKFDPFAIPVNKNFIKNLYKCSFEMGKELFDNYPQFGNINGNLIPLRSVAKKFDSLEQAYFKYGKAIGFNPEKHHVIIELVKWANENNILNCSLASFIVNEGWHDLEALRSGKDVANINYDAVRIL
jgi:DNA-directed RNA polymerase subunit H (RpoH/RPB5)